MDSVAGDVLTAQADAEACAERADGPLKLRGVARVAVAALARHLREAAQR
ncbi:hypothetical protein [Pseudonocardia sp.]